MIKKKDANIFITENKKNYLHLLAQQLKADIIEHNNFIGGRYSVLSEVGMLPAELMDLDSHKFKQLNNLIKNKNYLNCLVNNVDQILHFAKRKIIGCWVWVDLLLVHKLFINFVKMQFRIILNL